MHRWDIIIDGLSDRGRIFSIGTISQVRKFIDVGHYKWGYVQIMYICHLLPSCCLLFSWLGFAIVFRLGLAFLRGLGGILFCLCAVCFIGDWGGVHYLWRLLYAAWCPHWANVSIQMALFFISMEVSMNHQALNFLYTNQWSQKKVTIWLVYK
jgi:hypothetical protein